MKKILFVCIAMAEFYFMKAQKTEGDSIFLEMLSTSIMLERPDSNFVPIPDGNGYAFLKINATIKGAFLPGNYIEAEDEFKNIKSTEKRKVLDTIHHMVNKKRAFSLIQEEIAPANSGFENCISIITIVPNTSLSTYLVVGVYPKSHDKALRKKFIASALSLMK